MASRNGGHFFCASNFQILEFMNSLLYKDVNNLQFKSLIINK